MKRSKFLFSSVVLFAITTLFAKIEKKLEVIDQPTTNCQLPTANCNNSSLDLSCYLMMNSSTIEEGTKAAGEALGIWGREEGISGALSVRAGLGRNNGVSAVSSNVRLQTIRDTTALQKKQDCEKEVEKLQQVVAQTTEGALEKAAAEKAAAEQRQAETQRIVEGKRKEVETAFAQA